MRRRAMARYFQAVDSGRAQWEAVRLARAEYVKLSGVDLSERQIRRIAERVDSCGGAGLAPIDAYSDLKSVPYVRGKRGAHHNEAATAASFPLPQRSEKKAKGGPRNGRSAHSQRRHDHRTARDRGTSANHEASARGGRFSRVCRAACSLSQPQLHA